MSAERQMPLYQCHKKVWALKIARMDQFSSDGAVLIPEEEGYGPIEVNAQYVCKHQPVPGGYYVVYEDGYKSFSPAAAFEEGYKEIPPHDNSLFTH